jgi:RHS Repeat
MVTATVKGETTRYTYDANGKLATILHPNGILDSRSYDAAGRVVKITGTFSHAKPFYSRSYTYDPVGNPTSLEATDVKDHSSFSSWWKKAWKKHEALSKWTETYSYDSQDRLTKACMNARCSRNFEYAYDQVGNRTGVGVDLLPLTPRIGSGHAAESRHALRRRANFRQLLGCARS